MNVTGECVNFEEFNARVKAALLKVSNLTPVFLLIASDWYKDNQQMVKLKGNGQWEDLSPEYKTRKARPVSKGGAGFIYPILKFSGKLYNSITNPSAEGAVRIIGKQSLVLGTNVTNSKGAPYPVFHQSGAGNNPERPFIFNKQIEGSKAKIFASANKRYLRTLETYVVKEVKKMKKG